MTSLNKAHLLLGGPMGRLSKADLLVGGAMSLKKANLLLGGQVQSLSKGSQGTQRLSLERPSGNTGMIGHQRMNLPIGMMTNGKIGGATGIGKIGMKARMRATLGG